MLQNISSRLIMVLHHFRLYHSLNCQTKSQHSSIVCCLCSGRWLQHSLPAGQVFMRESGFFFFYLLIFFFSVPEFAKVRRWPSCEVNGLILLWFHCDGKDPEWTVPEHQEVTKGEWVYRGRTEHFINAHIQVGVKDFKRMHRRQDRIEL